jgi:hypothetical protein
LKVKFLSGPKTGTIEHLPPHVCQPLLAAGLIEYLPYKTENGIPAYVQRLSAESARLASAPVVSEWGTCEKNGVALIVFRLGAETFYHDSVPVGCPEPIKAQWQRLQLKNSEAQQAADAAERQRAHADREREQLVEMNRR